MGYMLLGVYLKKYPILLKKSKALFLIIILSTVAILPILYCYLYRRDLITVINNNLSISSVLLVISIFIFFQNFGIKNQNFIGFVHTIARHSFGIYLIHIIIVRELVWTGYSYFRPEDLNPLIETPAIALVSMAICFVIVKLFSKLPYSNYIVGV